MSGLASYSPVKILDGIRPYNRVWLPRDILAGITLAALAIPEVMGYTKIAGMPVITGLYTILIPIAVRHPRLVAPPRRRRRLRHGGDLVRRPRGSWQLGFPVSTQWVALQRALADLGRRSSSGPLARLGFLADFLSRTVLIGFLTGVGIQVAAAGRRHARRPDAEGHGRHLAAPSQVIGHARGVRQRSAAPCLGRSALTVIVSVDQSQVPGGLIAVVGAIVASWALTRRRTASGPWDRAERPAALRSAGGALA